ncbi:hypothetical protein [Zavarzinella formosa]|uniref:hypothetical protein n=1 Tax=Zavarzinella formosa TaxID=360055 RepID=UPI0002D286D3|nr:hypothetical protein [Zavarzinella formosa]
MIRFAACLMVLFSSAVLSAQVREPAKPGDEIPKSVGKVGGLEVFVQGYVSNSVKLTDWKMGENQLTAIAVWDGKRPHNNIRFDFYDAENVRVSGGFVNEKDLVQGEKSRLTFPMNKGLGIKSLKITRDLKNP